MDGVGSLSSLRCFDSPVVLGGEYRGPSKHQRLDTEPISTDLCRYLESAFSLHAQLAAFCLAKAQTSGEIETGEARASERRP